MRNTPSLRPLGEHDTWALFAIGAIAFAALLLHLPLPLNHDAAWHFETSFRLLEGARFGDGVYDVNPPMAAWLFTLPAVFVKLTGLSPTLVFKLFTFAVMACALLASKAILRKSARSNDWQIAVLAFVLLLLPGYDFGQREHLVVALTLPYVLLAALRADDENVSLLPALACGCAAALGIGMKPYFLALPLCVEAWLQFRSKDLRLLFRPEALSLFGTLIVYLALVRTFAPDYLARVVPDAMLAYGAFQPPWENFAAAIVMRFFPAALAALLAFALLRPSRSEATLPWASLAAALGFLFAALWQRKGWTYQLYPAVAWCLTAVGFSLFPDGKKRAGMAALVLVFALFVAIAPIAAFVADAYSPAGTASRVRALTALFRANPGPNNTVYGFITSPRDIHPAVLESRARWASASGVLVFLPVLVNGGFAPADRAKVLAMEDRRDRELLADLAAAKPGVIVVDDAPSKLGIRVPNFDYLGYFARYHEFVQFMRGYTEQTRVGDWRIFLRRH
ncbi:MAG TPA: hypothetical protein VID67_08250 [Rhizomicrobium sp.]